MWANNKTNQQNCVCFIKYSQPLKLRAVAQIKIKCLLFHAEAHSYVIYVQREIAGLVVIRKTRSP